VNSLPAKYTKSQRQSLDLQIKETNAKNTRIIASGIYVSIICFSLILVLTYVHIYVGHRMVLTILSFLGIIAIGFLFAYMNDRSQERAQQHSIYLAHAMGGGLNEIISQGAKTKGAEDRGLAKIWVNEQIQNQRIESSKKILEDKIEASEPKFLDDDIIDTSYDRYQEIY